MLRAAGQKLRDFRRLRAWERERRERVGLRPGRAQTPLGRPGKTRRHPPAFPSTRQRAGAPRRCGSRSPPRTCPRKLVDFPSPVVPAQTRATHSLGWGRTYGERVGSERVGSKGPLLPPTLLRIDNYWLQLWSALLVLVYHVYGVFRLLCLVVAFDGNDQRGKEELFPL